MAENTALRLRMLREFLSCTQEIFFWVFDTQLRLVDTTCPDSLELQSFFLINLQEFCAENRDSGDTMSVIFTNGLGLTWILGFEDDPMGQPLYVHVMGPVVIENLSGSVLERRLSQLKLSEQLRSRFLELIRKVPLVPLTHFLEYGQMLHYCLRREKITHSDFRYADVNRDMAGERPPEEPRRKNLHASWVEEQKMLRLIEEGNLDYRKISANLARPTSANLLGSDDTLRSYKNMSIVHTALFTRAAIRGGLDPEIAYTLSDYYLRGIEGCGTVAEVGAMDLTMQDDFITRVHQCRIASGISVQVLKCCGYIRLHLGEKLGMEELAQQAGYSATHLARKFKAEMGVSVKQYILDCRMEQARELLLHGDTTVQDICDQLGFGSQSYFGDQFRRATGMTPLEYRSRKGR